MSDIPRYPSPEVNECPYPFYATLRKERPIYQVPGSTNFLVTRYDDIIWVLENPDIFSSKIHFPNRAPRSAELDAVTAAGYPLVASLQENDPPGHDVYRRLVQPRFTPAAVRRYEPRIRAIVAELIDKFVGRGAADFIAEFARPLPLRVILSVLELPDERYADFKRWSDGYLALTSQLSTHDERIAGRHCLNEMQHFFAGELRKRRVQPASDIIGVLAQAIDREPEVTFEGAVNLLCRGLIIAGNETTVFLVANTMTLLLQNPDTLMQMQCDPSQLGVVIEESLRFESPNQYLLRAVVADVRRHGVVIKAGSTVALMWGSANRDEARIADADVFDPWRPKESPPHLAFGRGLHNCLGSHLARREAFIAFETLLRRLSPIQLNAAASDLAQIGNDAFRAPRRLALQFSPAEGAGSRDDNGRRP